MKTANRYAAILLLMLIPFSAYPADSEKSPFISRIVSDIPGTADPGRKLSGEERLVVDRIRISGNRRTGREVILAEFTFSEGDRIGRDEIEQTLKNLRNRKIFHSLDYGIYDTGNRTVLQLRMKDKWTLLPVLSFTTDEIMTVLQLGVQDYNLFGSGSSIVAYYSPILLSEGETKHNYRIRFRQNRLGGSPFRLYVSGGVISELRFVRDDDGSRIMSYSFDGYTVESVLGFSIRDFLIPEIGLEYSDNYVAAGETGSGSYLPESFSQGFFSVKPGIIIDLTDQTDHRKEGFYAETSLAPAFSLYGLQDSYLNVQTIATWSDIFARRRLFYTVTAGIDYSGSRYLSNYPVMETYLRGGTSREYQTSLIWGGRAEFSFTPIFHPLIVLDLAVFTDFARGGESFPDSLSYGSKVRYGIGLRYSIPSIAKFRLRLDLAFTENGKFEFVIGM